jgi:hypothetical protein
MLAPPTPCAEIVAARWWHLEFWTGLQQLSHSQQSLLPTKSAHRPPGRLAEPSRSAQSQTEAPVPSALVQRWVSFPQAPAAAGPRTCVSSLCPSLERQPLRSAACHLLANATESRSATDSPTVDAPTSLHALCCTAALSGLNLKPIPCRAHSYMREVVMPVRVCTSSAAVSETRC